MKSNEEIVDRLIEFLCDISPYSYSSARDYLSDMRDSMFANYEEDAKGVEEVDDDKAQ